MVRRRNRKADPSDELIDLLPALVIFGFTQNAERLARSNNIELWDRDKLIDFLCKARGKK